MSELIKKMIAVALCSTLVGGMTFTLPAVVQDSGIVASAATVSGNFEYILNEDNSVTITKYTGSETSVVVPSKIDGLTVSKIGDRAFSGLTGITSVNLGQSITTIGYCAFDGCTGITSVSLPEKLESIEGFAFDSCENLKSIFIPITVTSIAKGAFEHCKGLTSITIPSSVTNLERSVFYDCTGLTSAIIGKNVAKLSDSAFYGCTALKSVAVVNSSSAFGANVFDGCDELTIYATAGSTTETYAEENSLTFVAADYLYKEEDNGEITITKYIGDDTAPVIPSEIDGKSVTKLADESFRDRPDLTSVTIPKGITSIGLGAFWRCTNMTSVNISDSVAEIGLGAFYGCSALKSITIPKKVTKINTLTFYQCTGLETVNIAGNITEIGASAFNYCSSLKKFTIPDTVTTIGASAFSGTSLTSVDVPTSVTSIGNNAFSNCKKLTKISFPNKDVSFGTNVFLDTDNVTIHGKAGSTAKTYATENNIPFSYIQFEYVEDNEGNLSITKYIGVDQNVSIPSTIDGKPVAGIGAWAFDSCTGIKSVYIANGVKEIGWAAFYSCTGLKKVSIPNSVTTIGTEAFSGCTGLTEVMIGRGVTKINASAFEGCTALTSAAILNGNTDFGDSVFKNCSNLTVYAEAGSTAETYTDENNIPFVAAKYLYEENDNGEITITKYIGSDTQLVIPSEIDGKPVTKLADESFWDCPGLTSVTIPKGITSIGLGAFWCCTNMTSVDISDSVAEIGLGAFYGCSALKSITIPKKVTKINTLTFYQCTGLETVNIAGNITEIGVSAFNYCSSLKKFTIPDTVTNIGASAFSGTSLTSVDVPTSVTSIGNNAFSNCKGLTRINIPGNDVIFGTNVFLDTDNVTIYGKVGSTSNTYADENNIPFADIEQKPLKNNSTISKSSVPQNTSVFVKGAAEGGEGEYKYAFYYKKSTSPAWATIGELYGKTTEVSFVPATVAKYLVKVNVKDSTGKIVTKIYEVNSTKPTGNDLVNTSILDKTTTQRNTPITITGSASGGAGGYKYAFYYKKTTSKAFTAIGKEYGDATTATFTPATTAEYNVRINVMDSDGTIVTKQYKITATAISTLSNDSTIGATMIAKGTKVSLSGAASGGTSPYSYDYYYKKSTSSSWTKIATESPTTTSVMFTPAMKATYNLKIVVKDSTGKTAEKTFSLESV